MSIIGSGVSVTAPTTAPTLAASAGGGNLSAGNYLYRVSFVSNYGETVPGPASSSVTATLNGTVNLLSIPVGGAAVISRNIYRTAAGGTTYGLVTTISDNISTTYTDTLADGSRGVAPLVVSTADSVQQVNGYVKNSQPIISSVTAGIVAKAGGGQTGATQLVSGFNVIGTSATSGDSVILPPLSAALVGMMVSVRNAGAAAAAIFPAVGGTINGGSANASISLANAAGTILVATSATNWQQMM